MAEAMVAQQVYMIKKHRAGGVDGQTQELICADPVMLADYPDEHAIRNALLERVRRFAELTGTGLTMISKRAVNDTRFLADVARGKNFTIGRYMRVFEPNTNWRINARTHREDPRRSRFRSAQGTLR